jgi:ubiquinone/menaquinone biosynthesis C-methylase UbiE
MRSVGLYSKLIFPPLCDLLLDRPSVAKHRHQLLATAQGEVLEIGLGTGLNLPHYPAQLRRIIAVDPNPGTTRLAQRRARRSRIELDHRTLGGERLPFEDDRFDCAVSTFTLCSIEHVDRALGEVYRVLKPGGRLLFLEHGLSPQPNVQKWQRRLNWLQMGLGDGCRLDRNMKELVAAQPFSSVEVEEFYLERTPRTHGYLYRGIARK